MHQNIKIYIFSFSVSLGLNLWSQQNTHSPYSLFGIGISQYDGFVDNIASGRNGGLACHVSNFNFTNPSSLSALQHATLILDLYRIGAV